MFIEHVSLHVVPYSGPLPYSGPRPHKRSKKTFIGLWIAIVNGHTASKTLEFRFAVAVTPPPPFSSPRPYNGPTWIFPISGEKRANRHLSQHWFSCLFKSKKKVGEDSLQLVKITTVLLPGVWAVWARDQRCNASSAFSSVGGRACALCKAVSKQKELAKEKKASFYN